LDAVQKSGIDITVVNEPRPFCNLAVRKRAWCGDRFTTHPFGLNQNVTFLPA
jgi:hypothetical protein